MTVIVNSDGGNISDLFGLKKQSVGTAITRLRKNKQIYFRKNFQINQQLKFCFLD